MCNNSPAEWIGPENGWRIIGLPMLVNHTVLRVAGRGAWVFPRSTNASLCVEMLSADLGCSSNYSMSFIED